MSIDIPGGPGRIDVTGGIGSIPDTASGSEVAAVDAAEGSRGNEAVTRIADDLAAGRIDGNQALDRLVAEVMGDELVRAAPDSVREELIEVLAAMIETDPQLAALARFLGADPER